MQNMAKAADIILLLVTIALIACTPRSPTARPPTQTTVRTPTSLASPTATSVPTPTPSPSPSAWPTPTTPPSTPRSTAAPRWALLQDFSTQPSGVMTMEVLPRCTATFVGLGADSQIEIGTFQVDLLVVDTGYTGPWYSVDLQLNGLGTGRSWYAEMGYQSEDGHLGVHCHAYSLSKPDAGRF